jgi:prolipoprotein diacylglyceryltransferase/protein-S-isoprenylcysteine O-methyltransferase Ste14
VPRAPTDALSSDASSSQATSTPLIVSIYAIVFFGLLPASLWTFGARLDRLLALPGVVGIWNAVGVLLLVTGLPWLARSMLALSLRGSGWPISHLPPRHMVTSGPYRRIRHPVYAAYTVVFAGAGLVSGSLGRGLGASGLLCAVWIIYATVFEEPKLRARYGPTYARYQATTPLLPLPFGSALRTGLVAVWQRSQPGLERLANHTVLFRMGSTVWVMYGAFLGVAGAVTAAGIIGLLGPAGIPRGWISLYVLGLAVSMVVGGRLIWLAYQTKQCRSDLAGSMRTVGFVSWGALLGMLGFAMTSAVSPGVHALSLLDRTMIPVMASVVFGRIGCFTYGCCYGRPSPLGICWSERDTKVIRERGPDAAVSRIPTQLLASLHALLSVCALVAVTFRPVPDGTVTGLALLFYGLGRLGIDRFRAERRYGRLELTSGQIGGAGAVAIGMMILFLVGGGGGWPQPATAADLSLVLAMWPSVLAVAAIVFVSSGFHWKQVGRW